MGVGRRRGSCPPEDESRPQRRRSVLLQEPPRSQGDLNFVLFGVPIRIHPMFWIVGLLLGMSNPSPAVLLRLDGGVVLRDPRTRVGSRSGDAGVRVLPVDCPLWDGGPDFMRALGRSARGIRGLAGEMLISAAGPAAGSALAAAIYALLRLAQVRGCRVTPVSLFVALPHLDEVVLSPVFSHFINHLLFVSVFWGLVNLLPIYPLDGGQIAREFLEQAIARPRSSVFARALRLHGDPCSGVCRG